MESRLEIRSKHIGIAILLLILLMTAGCQPVASSASQGSPVQTSFDDEARQMQKEDDPAASVPSTSYPDASAKKTVETEPSNKSKQSSAKKPSTAIIPSTTTGQPSSPNETLNSSTQVAVQIVGDKAHGVIIPKTKIEWKDGDTVLKVLQRITKASRIQMETSGMGAAAYIHGIDNLYEFDQGAKSGWVFRVNGIFSNKGAGAYSLKRGDVIELLYTVDLGKDVGDAQ